MIYIEILYIYTFVLLINEIAVNRRNCVLKLKWKHLKLYIITISYLYKIIIIIYLDRSAKINMSFDYIFEHI